MPTDNTGRRSRERYEDFRTAIEHHVLLKAEDGHVMVGSEQAGTRDSWMFDFRALLLQPRWLDRYAEIFWEQYGDKLPFQVGGLETAGISLVAAIVMKGVARGTPVNGFYMRKSRKRHGLMKYIEGTLTDAPIILVDDLANSGESIRKQLDILERANKRITDAFVLLAFREESAYAFLRDRGVAFTHLFTLPDFGMPYVRTVAPETDVYETLWHYSAPHPSLHVVLQKSAPVLDDERVYFGRDDGVFVALDQRDGSIAWEFETGRHPFGKGILSSPLMHGGRIFFGAYDGSVYSLRAEAGKLAWRNDDADWIGSSPEIAPDLGLLYVGLEHGLMGKRGGIAALDLATGKRVWSADHPSLTHGSPLYIKDESLVVIGSNNGILYAYDAKTGALRWRVGARSDVKTKAAYDPKRRLVIFSALDGILYAIRAKDGTPVYARELGAAVYSVPLIVEDTAYIACLDKYLYAIDLNTWKQKWTFETAGRIFASPLMHAGSLWIGSNDGRLYEIDPRNGTRKSSFQATERIVNRIAASGEKLFVPTVANELYCITRKNS